MNGLSAEVALAYRPLLPLWWLILGLTRDGRILGQHFAISRPPLPSLAESRHAMVSGTS